jgi:hypothetical protein
MRYTTGEERGREKIGGYRVFLSHSHKDRWIARQCARLIEEASKPHVQVFFDEKDIEGGQSIPDSVRSGSGLRCDAENAPDKTFQTSDSQSVS